MITNKIRIGLDVTKVYCQWRKGQDAVAKEQHANAKKTRKEMILHLEKTLRLRVGQFIFHTKSKKRKKEVRPRMPLKWPGHHQNFDNYVLLDSDDNIYMAMYFKYPRFEMGQTIFLYITFIYFVP